MALEQQSLKHAEETWELRAEISHLKSLEQSQVQPRLPPPTQSLSTQSPPACVDFQDELADRLDQIHTMAEAVRKPPTPPQPSTFTERRKLGKSLKPNTFDGVSPWEDYKAQFDLIAELNGWGDETKAVYLAASLKGHAQAVLGDLDERRRRDFTSLVAALSSRFGAEHQTELYRTQLKTLLRKKEQTLPELAQTRRRLTRQAYPEATEAIRETLARDHFIDALPDADVRWRIQQTRPKLLQDALTTAVELEAFQLANLQRGQVTRAVVAAPQDSTTARPVSENAAKPAQSPLDQKLDTMAELLQSLVASLQSPRRPPGRQNSPTRCWTCGKAGHLQRNCQETVAQNQGNGRQPDSRARARQHQD